MSGKTVRTTNGFFMVCLSTAGMWLAGCQPLGTLPPAASVPRPIHQPSNQFSRQVPDRSTTIDPEPVIALPAASQNSSPWMPPAPARDWDYIVLHHTASDAGSVESIHRTHRRRRDQAGNLWRGIGYHFVIGNGNGMPDGSIESTFRWRQQIHGAHAGVSRYNERGIGIVLVGDFEKHAPTPDQLAAARQLVSALQREYEIADGHTVGHSDVKNTACPGRFFDITRVSHATGESALRARHGRQSPDLRIARSGEESFSPVDSGVAD